MPRLRRAGTPSWKQSQRSGRGPGPEPASRQGRATLDPREGGRQQEPGRLGWEGPEPRACRMEGAGGCRYPGKAQQSPSPAISAQVSGRQGLGHRQDLGGHLTIWEAGTGTLEPVPTLPLPSCDSASDLRIETLSVCLSGLGLRLWPGLGRGGTSVRGTLGLLLPPPPASPSREPPLQLLLTPHTCWGLPAPPPPRDMARSLRQGPGMLNAILGSFHMGIGRAR